MILFVGFLLMEIVMPQISRTALVPYSAEQMYQLVNDVQSYPQFLPGCTGSRILESTPGPVSYTHLHSRSLISECLSCCFLPLATPIFTLHQAFFQYRESATTV